MWRKSREMQGEEAGRGIQRELTALCLYWGALCGGEWAQGHSRSRRMDATSHSRAHHHLHIHMHKAFGDTSSWGAPIERLTITEIKKLWKSSLRNVPGICPFTARMLFNCRSAQVFLKCIPLCLIWLVCLGLQQQNPSCMFGQYTHQALNSQQSYWMYMFISVLYSRHWANPQQMLSSKIGRLPKPVKLSMESEPQKSLTKKETLVSPEFI